MIRFNTQQPLTREGLAVLYANGEPQLSAQSQGWVDSQASNLIGPGGATNFFAGRRQDAYNTAAAQQNHALQMAQLAGQDTSPDAARNAQIDQASAMSAKVQAAQLATLQNQNLQNNPLPLAGQSAQLTPLQQSEAARMGMTPDQFNIQARLGSGVSNELSRASGEFTGPLARPQVFNRNVSAQDLMKDPNFVSLMQKSPAHAEHAFEAITGGSLRTHLATTAAADKDQAKFGQDFIQRNMEHLKVNPETGNFDWEQQTADPITGQMRYNGQFGTPNKIQQHFLDLHGPSVFGTMSTDLDELRKLRVKAAADTAASTTIQDTASSGTPSVFQSKRFATLQKKNPALAAKLWRNVVGTPDSNILGPQDDPNAPLDLFDRSY